MNGTVDIRPLVTTRDGAGRGPLWGSRLALAVTVC